MVKLVLRITGAEDVTVEKPTMETVQDAGRLVKDIGTEGIGRLIDGDMIYYPPHRIEEITVSLVPEEAPE